MPGQHSQEVSEVCGLRFVPSAKRVQASGDLLFCCNANLMRFEETHAALKRILGADEAAALVIPYARTPRVATDKQVSILALWRGVATQKATDVVEGLPDF